MNIKISEIRKFKVNNEIKEGMVHGKFKDNSFIVVVKNFETGEDEDFIVHESEFVSDENLNTSDVSDSELFTLQDIKDAVTIAFRWDKPIGWGESPDMYDEDEKILFNKIIKELRLKKSE